MSNLNTDPVLLTIDRPYNSDEPTGQARQYKAYFDRFVTEFGADYEIWVREDGNNKLAVGIVNRHFGKAVTIWFKYHGIYLPHHPLSPIVIEATRNHLISPIEDLQINYPY